MIRLPIFTSLRVTNYGLFPGRPSGSGLEWVFDHGLSLIAGVNGLGKTTLVTMILRCLTGPYDLTGDGTPDFLESILPADPVSLKSTVIRFFKQRVADQAEKATVTIKAKFGTDEVEIIRQLSDLRLIAFTINGAEQALPPNRTSREGDFQKRLCSLFGLGSFVDVILILHHVVFFAERRPGALWDENAQRQILRALFLDKQLSARVSSLEREVGSADSKARNIGARAFGIEQRLEEARNRERHSPGISADLTLEQKLLDAEMEESDRLSSRLSDLDDERRDARREYEQAKLYRERAENAVEELKFAVLARLFPKMEDAARLVILKILATGECLVCGADARKRRDELEQLLAKGYCPACGAEPAKQENIVPPFKVERARVELARKNAELTRTEEEASRKRFEDVASQYEQTLDRLAALRTSIIDRTSRTRRLSALLPLETEEVTRLQDLLSETRREQKKAEGERAGFSRRLTTALAEGRSPIEQKTKQLAKAFRSYAKDLLSEEVELVRDVTTAEITQAKKEVFEVPVFRPKMAAADRPGLARRNTPDDVSQSQRELVDLAFRLALIRLATGEKSCSFIMETPEASLDELAMGRVGKALHTFSIQGENRLIVTTNLTNSGMITSMFGGPVRRRGGLEDRQRRVLNLLDIAAPNQAVSRDRRHYAHILETALKGRI